MLSAERNAAIRRVIADHARLSVEVSAVADADDLFALGMTSYASVNVMLAIEDAFGVEFPDRMLTRNVFASIDVLSAAVGELSDDEVA
jgi:acyl carrier protein